MPHVAMSDMLNSELVPEPAKQPGILGVSAQSVRHWERVWPAPRRREDGEWSPSCSSDQLSKTSARSLAQQRSILEPTPAA